MAEKICDHNQHHLGEKSHRQWKIYPQRLAEVKKSNKKKATQKANLDNKSNPKSNTKSQFQSSRGKHLGNWFYEFKSMDKVTNQKKCVLACAFNHNQT